ncbi:MAG: M14 family zinc carboxypeptidase [Vicinamibacterales bacterium]
MKLSGARTLLVGALLCVLQVPAAAQVSTPAAHFGFPLGTDRRLATADAIDQYFTLVSTQSDRVALLDLGATTDGHRTIAAVVSAPENIRTLDRIRATNQQLADPRSLTPEEAARLASTQKAIIAIGASVHSSEVGGTQAIAELLYELASATDAETLSVLQNVVVVLIPSMNPDGHRLVTDWYEKYKGTAWEGGPMPWLYQSTPGTTSTATCSC